MSDAAAVPVNLEARRADGVLHVAWPDRTHDFPFVELRGSCECAQCVNEWTGERILDPATIPADIAIESMELVGAYAVRVRWSDGHDSGLFTWQRLRELAGG
ncbi:MAG: hypothetical protein CMJ58_17010 [Planctomycetaceae bacterium]|nr:hypothetical protein [Planctomycetaceae bacterium]